MAMRKAADREPRWLLLIHQIPPQPAYFRQKVGRRLARLGAVAIKNSVYVLPLTEQTQEDFQWMAREIAGEGGDATICKATFVEGLRDDQIEALFHAARDADYASVAEESRQLLKEQPARLGPSDERRTLIEASVARLSKRLEEVAAVDFFGASGRDAARSALESLERRLHKQAKRPDASQPLRFEDFHGRLWVTRKNVHVDRIASAWLVRRFIDADARFKFVPGQSYRADPREVTFDMYEGTFTHIGDCCTFETLLKAFELHEPGLRAIGEIVHDIDIKDAKFGRPEAAGVATLVAGMALLERDDEARLELGGRMLDALLEVLRRKRGSSAQDYAGRP